MISPYPTFPYSSSGSQKSLTRLVHLISIKLYFVRLIFHKISKILIARCLAICNQSINQSIKYIYDLRERPDENTTDLSLFFSSKIFSNMIQKQYSNVLFIETRLVTFDCLSWFQFFLTILKYQ